MERTFLCGYRPCLDSQSICYPDCPLLLQPCTAEQCNAVLAVRHGLTQKADRHCATYVQTSCRGAVREHNKYTTSHAQPCDHAEVICTLPLMNMCFGYGQLSACANSGNQALFFPPFSGLGTRLVWHIPCMLQHLKLRDELCRHWRLELILSHAKTYHVFLKTILFTYAYKLKYTCSEVEQSEPCMLTSYWCTSMVFSWHSDMIMNNKYQ